MKRILMILFLLLPVTGHSQTDDHTAAIMKLTGCVNPEDADPDEMERLADLMQHPVEINTATADELDECGLLTPYQRASLMDYRSRHGYILSYTELAAVDGFGVEKVALIAPFVSLKNGAMTGGNAHTAAARQELSVRGGYRHDDDRDCMYGVKYRLSAGLLEAAVAASRKYDDPKAYPSAYTGSVSVSHSHGKIIAGDFNARFGQGLCLWNSAFANALTSPAAFMKKPSGISQTYSFTGTSALTGVAAEFNAGRWRFSSIFSLPGIKNAKARPDRLALAPAVNVTRYGKIGHISMTHYMSFSDFMTEASRFRIPDMKTSADASVCLNGVNLFGEVVYDWVNSALGSVAGTDFKAGENCRMASMVRYLPPSGFSNEYGAAFSCEFNAGRWMKADSRRWHVLFSADGSYFPESKSKDEDNCIQLKANISCDCRITDCLQIKCRVSERLRTWGTMNRTDIRMDFLYAVREWNAAVRMNVLECKNTGLLGYAEGGWSHGGLSLHLRVGCFIIDHWDDRIYVYERDAPGNFNVPAFYGRGIWSSSYLSYKPFQWLKLYLRACYTDYFLMEAAKRKPGRAELKIQSVFRL